MSSTPICAMGEPSGPMLNGNDVHRAAPHAAVEQAAQRAAHLARIDPVVGRAGVLASRGADEGAVLDARHVAGIRAGQVAVPAALRVQLDERAAATISAHSRSYSAWEPSPQWMRSGCVRLAMSATQLLRASCFRLAGALIVAGVKVFMVRESPGGVGRIQPVGEASSSVSEVQGLPVRSSMYARIRRRTTWEGVASSSAQSRSNMAFLRGSMRIVRRAVRSSRATTTSVAWNDMNDDCMIIICVPEYNLLD